MTVLNSDVLVKHGPYIHFLYRASPLLVPDNSWPLFGTYEADIFFNLSDDLLDCLCSLTKEYCPFDPYELSNLTEPASLQCLADAFRHWATVIESIEDNIVASQGKWLYNECSQPKQQGHLIKRDLIETLKFIIKQVDKAQRNGHAITIVGI